MPRPHVSGYFLFVLFVCPQEEGVLISGTNAKTQVFENSPPPSGVLWKRRIVVFTRTHENRGLRANDLMSFIAQHILCKGCGYSYMVLEFSCWRQKWRIKQKIWIHNFWMHTFLKRRKIPVFKSARMRVDVALVTRSVFSRKLSLLQRLLGLLIATEKKKSAVLLRVSIVNEAGVERETPTRLSPALRKRAHLKNAKQQARNLLSYG